MPQISETINEFTATRGEQTIRFYANFVGIHMEVGDRCDTIGHRGMDGMIRRGETLFAHMVFVDRAYTETEAMDAIKQGMIEAGATIA